MFKIENKSKKRAYKIIPQKSKSTQTTKHADTQGPERIPYGRGSCCQAFFLAASGVLGTGHLSPLQNFSIWYHGMMKPCNHVQEN